MEKYIFDQCNGLWYELKCCTTHACVSTVKPNLFLYVSVSSAITCIALTMDSIFDI